MSNSVLKVENVTMQFGGVVAVDNLNLDVHEGNIVSLIGPNGAGKTTVFNLLTGVYTPTSGETRHLRELLELLLTHSAGADQTAHDLLRIALDGPCEVHKILHHIVLRR